MSGVRKRRGRPSKSPLTQVVYEVRGFALGEHLRREIGDTTAYALEQVIFQEQIDLLARVFNGSRPLPEDRLVTIERFAPGATALYSHLIWDFLYEDSPWSTQKINENLKRLPQRLISKLFHPKSNVRKGPFERRQQSLEERWGIAAMAEDPLDGLALHVAFFREAEAAGDSEGCFLCSRQMDLYFERAIRPRYSQELSAHLRNAMKVSIGKSVDAIIEGVILDRDDLIDLSG